MRSLRARLLAATTAVLAAVLTALALFSARITRIEFHRFEDVLVTERHDALGPVRRILENGYRAAGSWPGARAAIEDASRAAGKEIVVMDVRGTPVARSSGLDGAVMASAGENALRVDWPGPPARSALLHAIGTSLHDAAGRPVGRFYVLPRERSLPASPRDFAGAANRWLAAATAAAGLAALLILAALSRRLLGPIESLTDAARKMEGGNRGVRVAVTSRDELGRLARSFNAMADAISRQETLRRNLVSDVAHELRTPLTSIRAQLEALQDGLAAPDPRAIDSLHEDARLLERLVDDLQDLALAEAGQLALDLRPLRLSDAATRAASAIEPRAQAAGVAISVEIPPKLAVHADRHRIGQIFSNLLGNALSHTPAGGRIGISAAARDGLIEIAVADTGRGIESEHLPHVFDRFYRTDPARSRSTGGAGLGLAIVRQLVRAQGGDATASSEPGGGTIISFTLPAAEIDPPS